MTQLNSALWNKWWILGWILLGVYFLFYEFYSGWGPAKHTPMLTQVVVRYVPWWATFIVINWLNVHFALRYLNPNYIKH